MLHPNANGVGARVDREFITAHAVGVAAKRNVAPRSAHIADHQQKRSRTHRWQIS